MMPTSPEFQARILRKIEEENKRQAVEMAKRADYKIQLWFKSDRKRDSAAYTLSFWESGKRLHGGGDEMMFICRRHHDAPKVTAKSRPFDVVTPKHIEVGPLGCGMLIPGGLVQAGFVICPHCQTQHQTELIGDSIFYRTSMQKAAQILEQWWRKLACNADIYVKYCPVDPRVSLMSKTMTPRRVRELKGLTIYPLKNIIADTAVGSTVESRFKALLTA
jgi:hypothetical protein